MTTAKEALKALDREFNAPGSRMHLETYNERHEVLYQQARVERQDAEAERERENSASEKDRLPMTTGAVRRSLESLATTVFNVVNEGIKQPFAKRLATLETKDQSTAALIADLEARIAALEHK